MRRVTGRTLRQSVDKRNGRWERGGKVKSEARTCARKRQAKTIDVSCGRTKLTRDRPDRRQERRDICGLLMGALNGSAGAAADGQLLDGKTALRHGWMLEVLTARGWKATWRAKSLAERKLHGASDRRLASTAKRRRIINAFELMDTSCPRDVKVDAQACPSTPPFNVGADFAPSG